MVGAEAAGGSGAIGVTRSHWAQRRNDRAPWRVMLPTVGWSSVTFAPEPAANAHNWAPTADERPNHDPKCWSLIAMSTCPRCTRSAVQIEFERNGLTYRMQSCGHCDTRTWAVDGTPSQLPAVLHSMTTDLLPSEATAV